MRIKIDALPHEVLIVLATSPKLPYYTFRDLYNMLNHKILLELAANERIPCDIAWDMVRKYEILKQENTDKITFIKKSKVIFLLSQNDGAPTNLLQYLSLFRFKYKNCDRSIDIASSASKTLEKMGGTYTSRRYYENSKVSLSVEELEMMLKSEDREKKLEAACNPLLPLRCMFEILNGDDKMLKYFLAKNQAAPFEILENLMREEDDIVKYAASKRIHNKLEVND